MSLRYFRLLAALLVAAYALGACTNDGSTCSCGAFNKTRCRVGMLIVSNVDCTFCCTETGGKCDPTAPTGVTFGHPCCSGECDSTGHCDAGQPNTVCGTSSDCTSGACFTAPLGPNPSQCVSCDPAASCPCGPFDVLCTANAQCCSGVCAFIGDGGFGTCALRPCHLDGDCFPDQGCVQGGCLGRPGAACGSLAECLTTVCSSSGICACASSELPCSTHADCCSGVCTPHRDGGSGLCVAGPCGSTPACEVGQECTVGIARAFDAGCASPPGFPCGSNADCVGSCVVAADGGAGTCACQQSCGTLGARTSACSCVTSQDCCGSGCDSGFCE